jgi:hypothetical protein
VVVYFCKGQRVTLFEPDWTAIADAWVSPDVVKAQVSVFAGVGL